MRVSSALAALLLTSSPLASHAAGEAPVSDEAPDPSKDPDGPGEGDRSFSHGGQFGIRVGAVGGYRMVFRYDKSPYCKRPDPLKKAEDQQKFCGHGMPMAIDIGLSFAPIGGAEPFLWARFGLAGEPQTNTEEVQILGAGVRIYTMSDSAFKIYIEPAIGYELEKGARNELWLQAEGAYQPTYEKDIAFHLAAGPQYDLAPAVGLYLNAGLTVGVLRAIHSSIELQGGAQVRFP